jgi:hypothetical protein
VLLLHRFPEQCVPLERFSFNSTRELYVVTVTAGGKSYLRTLSLTKLNKYADSYNIRALQHAIEKDDLIDAIISTRVRLSWIFS